MRFRSLLVALCCFAFGAQSAIAEPALRRFALAAGANNGGSGRPTLRYAISDAEAFAQVLETMGGVESSDLLLLKQPSLIELEDALEDLRDRLAASSRNGDRTQVIVYFSGHASEVGLMLGDELFSYRSLRNWMDLVDADVRIAVLDACASGSITRLKGPRRRRAFLLDSSSDTQGYAFLTSSSADEVAQESDRIGASFFTHYLVSGLRGAADLSGEGRVTLNEAYQFAFNETLSRTTETRAGAQHPSYDINLSGTGDVIMTDVRETSAALVLGHRLDGRVFVRGADGRVVAELYKTADRSVELGLPPGTYEVWLQSQAATSVATIALGNNGEFALGAEHFTEAEQEPVAVRGADFAPNPFGENDGRWSVGFSLGGWQHGGMGAPDSDYVWDTNNLKAEITASYWLREDLALNLGVWSTTYLVKSENPRPDDEFIAAFLIGVKKYFPRFGGLPPTITPFVSVAGGPYYRQARLSSDDIVAPTGTSQAALISGTAAGGSVGGGFDLQVARWGKVDVGLGYNFTADFGDDLDGAYGGKTSYSGVEFSVGFSFLFGSGSRPGR